MGGMLWPGPWTIGTSATPGPWQVLLPCPGALRGGHTREDGPASVLRPPRAAQEHSSDSPLGFESRIVGFFTVGMGQMTPHIGRVSSGEK